MGFRSVLSFIAVASFFGAVSSADAASVAIVQGSFYTTNLRDNLVAAGQTVTEITDYTAASLAGFDAVIHYGNSFTDTNELSLYVNAGGTLVLTPWSGLNFTVPANLQIFDNGGGASYSEPYPGVIILDPGNDLLDGVTFPAGPGGFDIGRLTGIDFVPGATGVADWADDGTGLLGVRSVGLGAVVGINMHVITSDTAFEVIDQPWATQLFVNAVNVALAPADVPEPGTLALLVGGLFGLRLVRHVRRA